MTIPRSILAALAVGALALPAAAHAESKTIAVFGDTPYGANQVAAFPGDIDDLNADPDVSWAVHVGDIKSGSSQCTDAYFAGVRAQFDRLADPLVYTPGDNEWTDCHRVNNGAFNPLERLAKLRSVFFNRPNRTLGAPTVVTTQKAKGLPENKRWSAAGTVFAALHVVGSNDSLASWTGNAAPTTEQQAEHDARLAANLAWLRQAFAEAKSTNARAVVLAMQADMWDSFAIAAGQTSAFVPIVEELAKQARWFGKPVLLINGDSHIPKQDQPLAAKSAAYPNAIIAKNLTRVIVQGSNYLPRAWIKLTVDDSAPAPLSWTSVQFTSQVP